jgi:hypothetical protein
LTFIGRRRSLAWADNMSRWFTPAVIMLAVSLFACATGPRSEAPTGGECAAFGANGALVLWLGPLDVQPGESVPLRVLWRDELGGMVEVPGACVDSWEIGDADIATLSADRRTMNVRANAADGATTSVTARIGARTVSDPLNVYRSADRPLVGRWRQDTNECGDSKPVAELVFTADGRYSVTWVPFETYKDYWGQWRLDRSAGTLALSVEGGNYVPADRVDSGRIEVRGEILDLGAASLGSPRDGQRCTAPFHRY